MIARHLVVLALVVATGCTHDFSLFEVTNDVAAGGAAGAGATDASSASGGAAATGGGGGGGAIGSGGLLSNGGGQATGGSGGTIASGGSGGLTTGGTSASGGTAGSAGAGGGAGGGAPDSGAPGCTAIYGTVPGYLLCDEARKTCRFLQVAATAQSCTTICAAHGGTCSGADNGDPGSCALTGTATCATLFASSICLCSRP